jgi:hypothetical protein
VAAVLICKLSDREACGRFWSKFESLGAVEVEDRHWSDVGVEHREYRLGLDVLLVREDYGELIVEGPTELVERLRS